MVDRSRKNRKVEVEYEAEIIEVEVEVSYGAPPLTGLSPCLTITEPTR